MSKYHKINIAIVLVLTALVYLMPTAVPTRNVTAKPAPSSSPTYEQVFPTREPCLYDQDCMLPTETSRAPLPYPPPVEYPAPVPIPYPAPIDVEPIGGIEYNPLQIIYFNIKEFISRFFSCMYTPIR